MKNTILKISNKYILKKQYIFIGVILLKLILMGVFSSDYQNMMFIPFVKKFLEGYNPYKFYYENRLISSFPYMPLMLLIESVGGILLQLMAPCTIFVQNFLFKLPLLVFDYIGYAVLKRMGVRFKYLTIFYSASPIMLYATYMHGQLDIIPTSLLLVSIFCLINWKKQNNLLWCGIFLGLAVGTKTHILAVIPIIFFYIASKKHYLKAVVTMLISVMVVLCISLPFVGKGLYYTVFLNKEQSVLFTVTVDYGSTQILIPILVLLILYFKVYELNYFNKELLLSMIGFLFAVFLICVPPNAGWFIWIVPFVALYFGYVMMSKHKAMLLYAGLNILYIFYFVFLYQTEYVDLYFFDHSMQWAKCENLELKHFVFTCIAACLGFVIYNMYTFGIASNGLYKRGSIPFTIGIAGDSGAGKSKLLQKIENLFGTGEDILFIEGDGDHKWERNDENWEIYTSLDPKANYLYRQADDIRNLRYGNYVERKDYDHIKGGFTVEHRVIPKKYIVLCGLHSLYLPQVRKELDLKIFMDTEDELRKFWKIERDVKKRGYSKRQILEQMEKRVPDAKKYIYPQKKYADMIITYYDKKLKNCMEENHTVLLSLKLNIDININFEDIISCFEVYQMRPEHFMCENFQRQELIFDGEKLLKCDLNFEQIAREIIPQYEDLFTYTPHWETGVDGIIQLFILIIISKKMKG